MNKQKNLDHVSLKVMEFYEKNPFPGFDIEKYDSKEDLEKQASWYAKLLDWLIPYEKDVIDVGCGTGQLACFLSLKDRNILGVDFSEKSIEKALVLKEKLELDNVNFQWGNVLDLNIKEKFDYVFCNGVLHHTPNPYLGFQNIVKITKDEGFIIIGLYNAYGRLMLKIRQNIAKISKTRKFKEKHIKKQLVLSEKDKEKTDTWIADQYEHPHESVHTIYEILSWFKNNNIKYINSAPPIEIFRGMSEKENLFKECKHNPLLHNRLTYLLVQLGWIFSLDGAGGYFVMIGQKQKN